MLQCKSLSEHILELESNMEEDKSEGDTEVYSVPE